MNDTYIRFLDTLNTETWYEVPKSFSFLFHRFRYYFSPYGLELESNYILSSSGYN